MGVAGVSAGGPAGAPSGTGAGNVAGDRRTVSATGLAITGGPTGGGGHLGTVPVEDRKGDGTLAAHQVSIDSVRLVFRGFHQGANSPSSATFQVIAYPGEPAGRPVDVLDTRNLTLPGNASSVTGASVAQRNGDIEISAPGATLEVNPVGANELIGGRPHFAVAQRSSPAAGGGTINAGTLAAHIDLVHGG